MAESEVEAKEEAVSIKTTVRVDSRLPTVLRRWDDAIGDALQDAAREGAETSERVAQNRVRTGLMSNIQIGPVRRSRRGNIYITFGSPAWYARFHEKGTSRGIKPLRFLSRGRTAARKVVLRFMAFHMGQVK